jgi:hypothetical protein
MEFYILLPLKRIIKNKKSLPNIVHENAEGGKIVAYSWHAVAFGDTIVPD